jgi:hypothetical protein
MEMIAGARLPCRGRAEEREDGGKMLGSKESGHCVGIG